MGIGPINWEDERQPIYKQREDGELVLRGLRHGHTFLQLSDLRGYTNLLYDFEDDEPKLWRLIEIVEQFNKSII